MTKIEIVEITEQEAGARIRAAADLIERDGWVQNCEYSNGAHCVRGALAAPGLFLATYDEVEVVKAQLAERRFGAWLVDVVPADPDYVVVSGDRVLVTCWNDAKGRTADEVLLYMRKFADEVDPQ